MRKLALLTFLLATVGFPAAAQPPVQTQQILSKVYTIDKKYRSMEGPGSLQRIYLGSPENPELLWIVGVRTEMVGEDGKRPQLPELMCHVNVDLDTKRHSALFGLNRLTAPRLVTLSQGMLSARVPDGFGFPIASNEPLTLFTQVLNHNIEHPKNLKVRHRVTFEYIRERDLTAPMKPLFNVGASGMVLLDDNPLALASMPTAASMPGVDLAAKSGASDQMSGDAGAEHAAHGTSCLMAARAPNAAGTASDYVDPKGRHMTGHWVVPPGKQVNRSDITWFMSLPFDALLHYAAVHLHPYAKSLSIRDVTTGDVVFEATAKNPPRGVGLDHVDTFVSEAGVPMYKDHQYELISVYDNTTKENHDSMASAFLGFEDREFVKPDPATLLARSMDLLDSGDIRTAVLRTSIGDIGIILLRDEAPAAVKQFLRLARVGAYSHAHVANVTPAASVSLELRPLTDIQRANIFPIAAETAAKHDPGALSICPGEASFTIMLGKSPDRDGRCTVFARVGPGAQVVREMSEAPRKFDGSPQMDIEIVRVDVPTDAAAAADVQFAPAKPVASLR